VPPVWSGGWTLNVTFTYFSYLTKFGCSVSYLADLCWVIINWNPICLPSTDLLRHCAGKTAGNYAADARQLQASIRPSVRLPSTGFHRQTAGKIAITGPADVRQMPGRYKPHHVQRMTSAQISVSQRLLRYYWFRKYYLVIFLYFIIQRVIGLWHKNITRIIFLWAPIH